MSAVNYQVIPIDLATARSAPGEALLGQGVAYDSVTVLDLPVGASCTLAFGDNRPPIPLLVRGQCFSFFDSCGRPYSVDEALRFANPAGAGVVTLLVSIGGAGTAMQVQ